MEMGNGAGVRAFVFDLDGTLIDSKLDLVHSVNAMLRETGRAQQPAELVASYIGHGAPQLIASVLGSAASEEQRREALAIFLAHYHEHKLDLTRPYPLFNGITQSNDPLGYSVYNALQARVERRIKTLT